MRTLGRLLLLLSLAFAGVAVAQVPQTLHFQGYLTTSTGVPVNAATAITFRLYDAASGGNLLWSETHDPVNVANGNYQVVLGSVQPFGLPFDAQYFLGVAVGADAEMAPRQALSSAGYAMRSIVADSVAAQSVSGAMIAPGAITPGKLALSCSLGDTLRQTASGWECAPLCTPSTEVCDGKDNNCDGVVDESWLNAGKYDQDQACGGCGIDCTAIYGKPNAAGLCNAAGAPVCEMACSAGYFDLNASVPDGCEFLLDPQAIYVSTTDPAATDVDLCGLGPVGTGGGHFPCKTIGRGIVRAGEAARSKVLVADGLYNEAVTMAIGRSLLGGYRADTWERHLATTNTILQGVSSVLNHDRTVIASGIVAPTLFEGFVVRGALNTKTSGNSYAIYVSGSNANLQIRDNVIQAGRGGPGSGGGAGLNGGAGANGGGRESSPANYDARIATGAGFCDASNNRTLINGGVTNCGADVVSGGDGGGVRCAPATNLTELSGLDGAVGEPGAGAGGGGAGTGGDAGDDSRLENSGLNCVIPFLSTEGLNGNAGVAGAHAVFATGCLSPAGSVSAGHWAAGAAQDGIAASNAGGGGGGGAGGGSFCFGPDCSTLKDRLGGHGGGGGAGGCGGKGGGKGASAGGVFGIFVSGGSAPVIERNVIVKGEGGMGGAGGMGGTGGAGGLGGAGGNGMFCAGAGGKGGAGGMGGHGSGGGGGCGGSSFGIFGSGIGFPNWCTAPAGNTFSGGAAGAGGQGGVSLINQGGVGSLGELSDCTFN